MRLIIAGSRDLFPSIRLIDSLITQLLLPVSEIVSGGAKGVDEMGELFVQSYSEYGVRYHNPRENIKLTKFPADWETHGKAADPIRNKEMAEYADALLLIWDGESRGSANMKNEMVKLGKPVYEIIIKRTNVV